MGKGVLPPLFLPSAVFLLFKSDFLKFLDGRTLKQHGNLFETMMNDERG
jgi:hypothetical protein